MLTYRPDLDGLRALAILPVLLFHAGFSVVSGGYVGVDVFFVLSGYLMTRIILGGLETDSFSFVDFYLRRARRIFPALFAMIACSSVAAWFLFMPEELEYYARSVAASALFYANVHFQRESGYFDLAADMKPLLHTWSLAVEEQFYLLLPLAMTLCFRFARRRILHIVIATAVISFAVSQWSVANSPEKAFYLLYSRVWELLLGSLVAVLPRPAYRMITTNALTAAGLIAILISIFLYTKDTPFPGVAAALPCLGAALIIHASCQTGFVSPILNNPISIFVGRISYSVYLWHWPLIVFLRYFLGHALNVEWSLFVVVMSLGLGALSWRFIEQPMRHGPRAPSKLALIGASSCAFILAVLFSNVVQDKQGFPNRLPDQALRIYEATYDRGKFFSQKCFAEANTPGISTDDIEHDRLCTIGADKPGPPQFLLWGDSHAAAIAPAIDRAAREFGLTGTFVAKASCPPLPDGDFAQSSIDEICKPYNDAVMALIKRHKYPYVFMAGYWPKYVHRAELPSQGIFFDPTKPPPLEDHSAPIRDGLMRVTAELKAQNIIPVLIFDVPEAGYAVPEVLAKAELSDKSFDIALPLSFTRQRQALSRKVLEDVAKANDLPLADPLKEICDDTKCRLIVGDTVLYRDKDHLSSKGAAILSPAFGPIMEQIKRSGASGQ
ncbi:acyltransferase family protein [Oryzifoliimicrobium ureilyticus]|uniref:acyltransferase family protein n=1 Tax=Oryzifoliimicrobium ureilyticus TaxID=3113724 RepID=UPI00307655CB